MSCIIDVNKVELDCRHFNIKDYFRYDFKRNIRQSKLFQDGYSPDVPKIDDFFEKLNEFNGLHFSSYFGINITKSNGESETKYEYFSYFDEYIRKYICENHGLSGYIISFEYILSDNYRINDLIKVTVTNDENVMGNTDTFIYEIRPLSYFYFNSMFNSFILNKDIDSKIKLATMEQIFDINFDRIPLDIPYDKLKELVLSGIEDWYERLGQLGMIFKPFLIVRYEDIYDEYGNIMDVSKVLLDFDSMKYFGEFLYPEYDGEYTPDVIKSRIKELTKENLNRNLNTLKRKIRGIIREHLSNNLTDTSSDILQLPSDFSLVFNSDNLYLGKPLEFDFELYEDYMKIHAIDTRRK